MWCRWWLLKEDEVEDDEEGGALNDGSVEKYLFRFCSVG